MKNESRSLNASLVDGATDGKYRKVRPNTTVAPGTGEDIMKANRSALNPYWNYDFIDQEAPSKVNPLGKSGDVAPKMSGNVADTYNNQMGANY